MEKQFNSFVVKLLLEHLIIIRVYPEKIPQHLWNLNSFPDHLVLLEPPKINDRRLQNMIWLYSIMEFSSSKFASLI